MFELLWSTPRRKTITSLCGLIAAIAGAITAVSEAAPTVEPWLPANREYVRDTTKDVEKRLQLTENQTLKVLRDLQIEQAEGKRDATDNDLAKWNLELQKTNDPTTRDMISRTMHQLEANKLRLNGQIDTLTRLKNQP